MSGLARFGAASVWMATSRSSKGIVNPRARSSNGFDHVEQMQAIDEFVKYAAFKEQRPLSGSVYVLAIEGLTRPLPSGRRSKPNTRITADATGALRPARSRLPSQPTPTYGCM